MSRVALPPSRNLLGEGSREVGAYVTAREQQTGETRTFSHSDCTTLEALREIVAEIDRLEGDWKIVCISTPNTIYRDMQGDRISYRNDTLVQTPYSAEEGYLGRIGRGDLLVAVDHTRKLEPRRNRGAA